MFVNFFSYAFNLAIFFVVIVVSILVGVMTWGKISNLVGTTINKFLGRVPENPFGTILQSKKDHEDSIELARLTELNSEVLHRKLVSWISLPDLGRYNISGFSPVAANQIYKERWRECCLTYSFALVCLVEYRLNRNFFESSLYLQLTGEIAHRLVEMTVELLKMMGEDSLIDLKLCEKSCISDLAKTKAPVDYFIAAVQTLQDQPDKDLNSFFTKSLGLSDEWEVAIWEKLREYNKSTLLTLLETRKKDFESPPS